MGFLDSIKDRFGVGNKDDYYDDEDYYDEDGYNNEPPQRGSGLLGNTPRPEASSISVYSHSTGRPVNASVPSAAARDTYDDYDDGYAYQQPASSYAPAPASAAAPAAYTPAPSAARMVSAQLPPYVIKPTAYDDVQSVIRRVRTDQPVVLAFQATRVETAKRILDFCFGLACGVDGTVEELGDSVFVVLPQGAEITEAEYDKLVADGVIARR